MRIREANEADRDDIFEAHVASIRGVDPTEYDETELDVWESAVSPDMYSISEPGSEFLVAEREGTIVGLAEATPAASELDKLYVDASYRRQGIATDLLTELEQTLRESGVTEVYVEASLNAVPFYEIAGYELIETHEKPITVDGTSVEMTMADMKRELR